MTKAFRVHRYCKVGAAISSSVLALLLLAAGAKPAWAADPGSVTTTTHGWSVTLRAKTTTVQAGQSIPAILVILDKTGHRARFDSCRKNGVFGMDLENRQVPQGIFTGAVACSTTLHPGRNVFHREISTDYSTCGGDTGRPCPAPLPAGIYHTVIDWPRFSARVPKPGKLTIRLKR
jgi:hypothetical protein